MSVLIESYSYVSRSTGSTKSTGSPPWQALFLKVECELGGPLLCVATLLESFGNYDRYCFVPMPKHAVSVLEPAISLCALGNVKRDEQREEEDGSGE